MGVAGATGTIEVGTVGSEEISLAISPVTEAYNYHTRGRIEVAAAAAFADLDMGGVTTAAFIWIKAVKASNEDVAESIGIKINAGSLYDIGEHHAFLDICNPKADAKVTQIQLGGNAVENTVVEYLIAGD